MNPLSTVGAVNDFKWWFPLCLTQVLGIIEEKCKGCISLTDHQNLDVPVGRGNAKRWWSCYFKNSTHFQCPCEFMGTKILAYFDSRLQMCLIGLTAS